MRVVLVLIAWLMPGPAVASVYVTKLQGAL